MSETTQDELAAIKVFTADFGGEGGAFIVARTAEDAVRLYMSRYPKTSERFLRERLRERVLVDGLILHAGYAADGGDLAERF